MLFRALLGRCGTVLLTAVILGIVLAPRLHELDALVTPDEPLWVARSANFYQALESGNLQHTYQFVHPGVTVMWIGAFAHRLVDPDLSERMGGQITTGQARELTRENERPIDRLVDLRIALVVVNALVVIALFCCLIPIVGRWIGAFAVVFLSLDPMHIGFTRLVHLDGLATNLLLVSLVAYVWHLTQRSQVGLVVSGIAAGLAVLTRSVNGILAPLVLFLSLVDLVVTRLQVDAARTVVFRLVRNLFIWGVVAASTFVVLWPAVWVAPLRTFRQLISSGSELASDPHGRQVLFNGQIIDGDPGWTYYPVVLAYRLSPVTVVGLVIAAGAMFFASGRLGALQRRLCLHLTLFAGLYIVVLSMASKKLDRYLLPSLAALDLVAALGITTALGTLTRTEARSVLRPATAVGALACGGLLLLQALFAQQSAPYFITSISPLKGGQAAAQQEISLGWGEGGKAVAEAIQAHPQIAESKITGGAWPRTIDYYLPFTIRRPNYSLTPSSLGTLLETQYLLVTQPEVQRQLYPAGMLEWFDTLEPTVTVWDGGRVYARLFDLSEAPIPPPFLRPDAPMYEWGGIVTNVASKHRQEVTAGAEIRVRTYFTTAGVPLDLVVNVVIVDGRGQTVASSEKPLRADRAEAGAVSVVAEIELPDTVPEGTYDIRISLQENSSASQLRAVHAVTRDPATTPVSIGSFVVLPRSADTVEEVAGTMGQVVLREPVLL